MKKRYGLRMCLLLFAMIGVIAGDMLGAFLPAVISAVYYGITKEPPRSFNIMP